MSENTDPKPVPTPAPQEITIEQAQEVLKANNFIAISNSDIAAIRNGGEANETLKPIVKAVQDVLHPALTKEIKGSLEAHFAELTGLEKNANENVFDFAKRGVTTLKTNSKDSTELMGVVEKLNKEIDGYKTEISNFGIERKKSAFVNDFNGIFDVEIAKYETMKPQLLKRYKKEVAEQVFNSRTEDGDQIVYRKNGALVDSNNQMFTPQSLIADFMKNEGIEVATDIKPVKKGDLQTKNTHIDKDNTVKINLYHKARQKAYEEHKTKPMQEMALLKRVKEIHEDLIKKNPS